jgi:hypothetical protein
LLPRSALRAQAFTQQMRHSALVERVRASDNKGTTSPGAMRKIFCHILRRHRPAVVVVGYADDHAITAPVCPYCGKHESQHADYA